MQGFLARFYLSFKVSQSQFFAVKHCSHPGIFLPINSLGLLRFACLPANTLGYRKSPVCACKLYKPFYPGEFWLGALMFAYICNIIYVIFLI